jgi:hypothetical protein
LPKARALVDSGGGGTVAIFEHFRRIRDQGRDISTNGLAAERHPEIVGIGGGDDASDDLPFV